MQGFVITTAGETMLARAAAGEALTITGTAVGQGVVQSAAAAKALTALIDQVAAATSSTPAVSGGQMSMIVEYRNDMNGGLESGFALSEFGIFASVGDDPPTLLYYASLGDSPSQVQPESAGLDVHRFPVAVAVSGDLTVTLGYPAGSFVTAEELEQALEGVGFANAPLKDTPVDGDGVVITDSADSSKTKRVLWSKVKEVLSGLFAAKSHTHAANQVQVSGGSSVEEALEAKISHTDEFTAEMQDLHGNARGLLCTVPSYAGPESASINAPPDVNWGTCLSLQVGSIRTLMLIDSSGLWIQYYNGESWSAWQKMLSASSPDVVRLGCVSRVGLGAQSAQNPSTVIFGAEPLMWYVVERGAPGGRNSYFFHGKVSGSNIWLANDSINTMSMSWSGNTLSYCHNNGSIWDNAGTTYDFYYFYK